MGRYRLNCIQSIEQLRASAPAWDDLWQRSEVTMPTVRAELVAQWVEQFAPQALFQALVVQEGDQLAAALPLVGQPLGRVFQAARMPTCEWSPSGDLLLDPSCDTEAALDVLAEGLSQLPWPLVWLDAALPDSRRWHDFSAAIDRAGLPNQYQERFQVGMIEITDSWDVYRKSWSKNHRKQMDRTARGLARDGKVELRRYTSLSAAEVEPLMLRGFEVENRSWKGEAGTSVLSTPGMFPFFVRQARQLAEWNQLELVFLEHNGQPVAFEYGWNAAGVYHSLKVSYDQQYAAHGPGQLLMYYLLQEMYDEPRRRAMDCLGPVSDAVSKWKPSTYRVGRLVIAPRRLLGRMLLHAYRHWWPRLRRLRGIGFGSR